MIGDIQGLVFDSLWLWVCCGIVYWAFLGFLVASKLRLSRVVGADVAGIGWGFGVLGLLVWAQVRTSVATSAAIAAAVPGRSPGLAAAWAADDWDGTAPASANEPWGDHFGPTTFDPSGSGASPATVRRSRRDVAGIAALVVGIGAAVVLTAALFFSWVTVSATGYLYADLSGSQSPWTVVPLLLSVVVLAGSLVMFSRTRQRRWTALAATASMPWLWIGATVAVSAGALDELAGRLADATSVPAEAGLERGDGLTLLIIGGALGVAWSIWMGVRRHLGGGLGAVGATSTVADSKSASAPSTDAGFRATPALDEDW